MGPGLYSLQKLLNRGRWPGGVRLAWTAIDVVFVSTMLMGAKAPLESPLALAYPIVIVAAGLWHDVACVAVSTYVSAFAYILLLVIEFFEKHRVPANLDRHAASLVIMAITGLIVAHQVWRIQNPGGHQSRASRLRLP